MKLSVIRTVGQYTSEVLRVSVPDGTEFNEEQLFPQVVHTIRSS